MSAGKRIKGWREAERYTQAQMAEEVGVSQTYLSDMEKGRSRVRLDVAARIAKVCKVADAEWAALRDDVGASKVSA